MGETCACFRCGYFFRMNLLFYAVGDRYLDLYILKAGGIRGEVMRVKIGEFSVFIGFYAMIFLYSKRRKMLTY